MGNVSTYDAIEWLKSALKARICKVIDFFAYLALQHSQKPLRVSRGIQQLLQGSEKTLSERGL